MRKLFQQVSKNCLEVRRVNCPPSTIGKNLIEWWFRNGRSYPWRKTSSPYRIVIAEIMLQRTRADQVLPVYFEFLKKFPTIFDLAKAPENEIGSFFKKLGLLWRAGLVKKMADFVVKKYDGILPRNRKDLLRIPAIGEYISSAMLSLAYGQPVVVIDSNVCRIVMRVYGLEIRGEVRRNKTVRELANEMLPPKEKSRFLNLALIDFGALICKPAKPLCIECPISSSCDYYHKKTQR